MMHVLFRFLAVVDRRKSWQGKHLRDSRWSSFEAAGPICGPKRCVDGNVPLSSEESSADSRPHPHELNQPVAGEENEARICLIVVVPVYPATPISIRIGKRSGSPGCHVIKFYWRRMMPQGTIKKLLDRGFGFIDGERGDLFFHSSAVEGTTFEELQVGQTVEYTEGQGPKGPRAENVRLV
jgi:CspA family cold shock protein